MFIMLLELHPLLLGLLLALSLNLLVFLFAFFLQTDKLTDLTYSATFILLVMVSLYKGDPSHPYRLLLAVMPILWALRLGSYLFIRILGKGKDDRFDGFRHIWWKFGGFYLLQGLSVWLISLPFLLALSASKAQSTAAIFSNYLYFGIGIFLLGLMLESIADAQKYKFRTDPENQGKFMNKGLFRIVRFPNYAGEILVWTGIFIAAIPTFVGWQWVVIISPIWIAFLLVKVSGIPQLEAVHAEKYGDLAAFQKYTQETDKLIPGVY
jgi:steroid 5-alpha reductase family enzyme